MIVSLYRTLGITLHTVSAVTFVLYQVLIGQVGVVPALREAYGCRHHAEPLYIFFSCVYHLWFAWVFL